MPTQFTDAYMGPSTQFTDALGGDELIMYTWWFEMAIYRLSLHVSESMFHKGSDQSGSRFTILGKSEHTLYKLAQELNERRC